MPAGFDKCVANGGRVRTKKLSGGRYMHICFLGGKSFAGEVKKKEKPSSGIKSRKKNTRKRRIDLFRKKK